MTDFFTRLAERILGMAPTVQPLITPMFAPEHNRADTGLFEATAEIPAVGTPLIASSRKTGETGNDDTLHKGDKNLLPHELDRSSEKSILMEVLNAPTMDEQPEVRSVTTIQPSSPPFSRRGSLQARSGRVGAGEIMDGEGTLVMVRREAVSPVLPIEGQDRGTAGDHKAPLPSQPHPVARNLPLQGSPPALTNTVGSHTFMGERLQEHGTFVGTVKRQMDVMGKTAPPSETPNPVPTIQVTIGRIEVRATPQAATPARVQQQSSKSPVMSLDEYLRRAQGGH